VKKFIAIIVSLSLFTLSAVTIHNAFLLIDYRSSSNESKVDIVIQRGDTGLQIAEKLEAAGVVKTAKAFYRAALTQRRSEGISPGVHQIDLKISSNAAIDQLLDRKRNRGVIGFVEGMRAYEVFQKLESSDLLQGDFSNNLYPDSIYKTSNLEGFLFPAQYTFVPGSTVDQAVQEMIKRFNIAATETGLIKGYDKYSPYEVLIVASIAQAEGEPGDFSRIARVVYNRLKIGMPLQINATIDYATKARGEIRMSYKQLQLNSKYNTYRYRGLTPTPIGNPGEDAMRAAMNPAQGDWLYFITVKPGDTRFTKSFPEFNLWVTEFRKNEDAGLFE
jgi:UPF0755 protein